MQEHSDKIVKEFVVGFHYAALRGPVTRGTVSWATKGRGGLPKQRCPLVQMHVHTYIYACK